jgi:hypothetical protein
MIYIILLAIIAIAIFVVWITEDNDPMSNFFISYGKELNKKKNENNKNKETKKLF